MGQLFLGLALGIVIGAVILYFYLKSTQVSRQDYETLQQNFIKNESELGNAQQKISELSQSLQSEKENLAQNIEQYNEIKHHLVKMSAEKDLQSQQLVQNIEQNQKLAQENQEISEKNREYFAEISRLKAQNEGLHNAMNEQKKAVEKLQEDAKIQFENIANKILEEKTEKFTHTNKENLDHILKPLGENLEAFKKKVDEVYQNEARERFSLNNTIKLMMEQSNKISQEANNLASALKGQTKIQGDWGEMILERILENSGLTKDREYFTQTNIKDEDGKNQRPDFIVKFPDNKEVIVDSKVSLNAYEKMTTAETPDEQEQYLTLHIRAMKSHIDTLAEKAYHKMTNAIDFTIMFVPIESAFLVAMQHESNLWNYAYQKNVIVLSPTNLIAYLKLISEVWKKYDQNKNSEEIARQAGDLYDKFEGLVSDLLKIGKKMDDAKSDYEEAMKKLSTGKGNLVRRVQGLKELGVKSKKNLPDALIERSNND